MLHGNKCDGTVHCYILPENNYVGHINIKNTSEKDDIYSISHFKIVAGISFSLSDLTCLYLSTVILAAIIATG